MTDIATTVRRAMIEFLAQRSGEVADERVLSTDFSDLGLDSLDTAQLMAIIEDHYRGTKLPLAAMIGSNSADELLFFAIQATGPEVAND